jgi:DNA-binding response OmpR family regulator
LPMGTVVRPCCLVAEDESLIALALEACLDEAGFDVAGPFPANRDALGSLDGPRPGLAILDPGLAILDVVLKDGPCLTLARELKSRGVPFAVYSGLPAPEELPPELRDVPWLEKPVPREALIRVLREVQSTRQQQSQPDTV